jgi:hypothetical protein
MILTGSGKAGWWWCSGELSSCLIRVSPDKICVIMRRLPKTARMKMSCTCSCLTRKLHSRLAGEAAGCFGLKLTYLLVTTDGQKKTVSYWNGVLNFSRRDLYL